MLGVGRGMIFNSKIFLTAGLNREHEEGRLRSQGRGKMTTQSRTTRCHHRFNQHDRLTNAAKPTKTPGSWSAHPTPPSSAQRESRPALLYQEVTQQCVRPSPEPAAAEVSPPSPAAQAPTTGVQPSTTNTNIPQNRVIPATPAGPP